MRIISKIKEVIFSAGIGIMALPAKVFGLDTEIDDILYGPPEDEIVSTETTAISSVILTVLRTIIIPLLLIIGLIIYWKKSKSQTKTKVIKSIIAILITVGLIVLITYIVNNII